MNSRFFFAAAAVGVVSLAVFLALQDRQVPGHAATGAASAGGAAEPDRDTDMRAPSKPGARTAASPDTAPILQAEQRVRDLEATATLAQQRLREAEQGLAASEAEVEALEQMIADIKARGEDPAEYSDLAMERFQPAFFRFQDAQAAYDNAERLRAEAEAAVAAARAELARRRIRDE